MRNTSRLLWRPPSATKSKGGGSWNAENARISAEEIAKLEKMPVNKTEEYQV